jgi:hypothetical protein
MAFTESIYEYFAGAAEATPGAGAAAPAYVDLAVGSAKPENGWIEPQEQAGVKAGLTREKLGFQFASWEQEGQVDLTRFTRYLTYVLNGSVSAPTTPASAVNTRLWTFANQMTGGAATQDTEVFWAGDPNIQIWRHVFGVTQELTVSSDASNDDGVTFTRNGFSRFPTKVSAPTLPSLSSGNLLNSLRKQLWIDTSSAWGTTEVLDRLVTAEVGLNTGAEPKRISVGPDGELTFTDRGWNRVRPTLTLGLEVPDMGQWDLFAAGTPIKARIRWNGDEIETVAGPITYYEYLQFDFYGHLKQIERGTNGPSNVTHVYTLEGMYHATLGSDVVGYVQNTQTALV